MLVQRKIYSRSPFVTDTVDGAGAGFARELKNPVATAEVGAVEVVETAEVVELAPKVKAGTFEDVVTAGAPNPNVNPPDPLDGNCGLDSSVKDVG